MISCEQCRELMDEFRSSNVSANEQTAFLEHLESCAECRKVYDWNAQLGAQIRSEYSKVVAAPEGTASRALVELLGDNYSKSLKPAVRYGWSKSRMLAIAAMLILLAGLANFSVNYPGDKQMVATSERYLPGEETGSWDESVFFDDQTSNFELAADAQKKATNFEVKARVASAPAALDATAQMPPMSPPAASPMQHLKSTDDVNSKLDWTFAEGESLSRDQTNYAPAQKTVVARSARNEMPAPGATQPPPERSRASSADEVQGQLQAAESVMESVGVAKSEDDAEVPQAYYRLSATIERKDYVTAKTLADELLTSTTSAGLTYQDLRTSVVKMRLLIEEKLKATTGTSITLR